MPSIISVSLCYFQWSWTSAAEGTQLRRRQLHIVAQQLESVHSVPDEGGREKSSSLCPSSCGFGRFADSKNMFGSLE